VGRNARARVNFGKEKFSYPKDEYYPLFCVLSEKEIASLDKLFEKYKSTISIAMPVESTMQMICARFRDC
jgi:hypothetical protein